ncbi:MAG: hypothetical protein H7311_08390 [Ramlibacter sp.]|nr:hypothetical protein [Cryobacterium sp.]
MFRGLWTAGRRPWLVLAAIALILSPSLLDLTEVDTATAGFAHTRDAVIGLIGIFITARIVDTLGKRRSDARDKERFQGISTIAFRGLSQTVNDVGRMLLAPAVGADLYSAGIPGFGAAEHAANLAILRSCGIEPQLASTSGFWDHIDDARLATDLDRLCSDREFVGLMLRVTSAARRRLQQSMAEWAPVMITVPAANDELGPGWVLADQLVLLAESWRALAIELDDAPASRPVEAVGRVQGHYVETIQQYRAWLDTLQKHAHLPTRGFVTPRPVQQSASGHTASLEHA